MKTQSIVECEIARRTHASHTQNLKYTRSNNGVSHLNGAVNYFQWVVVQCVGGHPDCAAALTNLARGRLQGYIREDSQEIDSTISLFRDALALRPQGHPDHPPFPCHLIAALNWCYNNERAAVDIHESAQLCCKLLHLCPEGPYLRSFGIDRAVEFVIGECNNLPWDMSDEGIGQRLVLELCPAGHTAIRNPWIGYHQHSANALTNTATLMMSTRVYDFIAKLSFCAPRNVPIVVPTWITWPCHFAAASVTKANLVVSMRPSLYKEALHLYPVGHEFCDRPSDNLGISLRSHFDQHNDIDDINKAISIHRGTLVLRPPGHPGRGTTLNNLVTAHQPQRGS
ncbi:hypothetical protein EDB19DRAFT_596451 [Suillus lakei]|nr:hypothetical protein EDB19DRAFT_596451 [Suillus lakei]